VFSFSSFSLLAGACPGGEEEVLAFVVLIYAVATLLRPVLL
jgi:hypothetical protein